MKFNIKILCIILFSFCNVLCVICFDDIIYLIETNSTYFNENFLTRYELKDKIKILSKKSSGVKDMINYVKHYPFVINLLVPDFYKHNYNDLKSNGLLYAGDIDAIIEENNVCVLSTKQNIEECDIRTEKLYYAKLASRGVLDKYPKIFDYVTDFNGQVDYITRKNVAVFSKLNANEHYYNRKIIINENYISDDTIAIIELDPIEDEIRSDLPVLTFKNLILPEFKDKFPNSMYIIQRNYMKYAFMYLLKNMDWNRVAIISDSDPYSELFEIELKELFQENKFMYTIERCMGPICDFDEPIKIISETEPTIIIANVGEEYAPNIVKYMDKYNLTLTNGVAWIVRDWAPIRRELISITSTPQYFHDVRQYDNLKLRWLEKALHTIANNYDYYENENLSNKEFAKKIQDKLHEETTVNAVLSRNDIKSRTIRNIFDVISIDKKTGTGTSHVWNEFIKPSSFSEVADVKNCNIKSSNYFKPCNDKPLMIIMLITLMFFVSILFVAYFFNRFSNIKYVKMS